MFWMCLVLLQTSGQFIEFYSNKKHKIRDYRNQKNKNKNKNKNKRKMKGKKKEKKSEMWS